MRVITTDTPLRLEDVAALPASAGRAGATERGLHVDTGPAAPCSLERHTRVPGQTYPYIDAEGRYHGSNIGTLRLATARDYTKNGWRLPEGFLDQCTVVTRAGRRPARGWVWLPTHARCRSSAGVCARLAIPGVALLLGCSAAEAPSAWSACGA